MGYPLYIRKAWTVRSGAHNAVLITPGRIYLRQSTVSHIASLNPHCPPSLKLCSPVQWYIGTRWTVRIYKLAVCPLTPIQLYTGTGWTVRTWSSAREWDVPSRASLSCQIPQDIPCTVPHAPSLNPHHLFRPNMPYNQFSKSTKFHGNSHFHESNIS